MNPAIISLYTPLDTPVPGVKTTLLSIIRRPLEPRDPLSTGPASERIKVVSADIRQSCSRPQLSEKCMSVLSKNYRDLLTQIGPMNRVHNGDEMALAVQALEEFSQTLGRGKTIVHTYDPGTIWNHWIVPKRWKVRDFRVTGPDGQTIVSKADHPLALCPYSNPVDTKINLTDLIAKTLTHDDRPDTYAFYFARMYRHWEPGWNISLPKNVIDALPEGEYHVLIDTILTYEPMQVFDYMIEGRRPDTVVIPAHLDHPGMINDSLSGCIVALQLAEFLAKENTEYTYKVWLLPEIIGSAVHLKANEDLIPNIKYALCPNMSAHNAPLAMCMSKSETSILDLALRLALRESNHEHVIDSFHKYPDCGDEISFDTVGYGIPATTLSRIGEMFKYYHSSGDSVENFLQADWQKRHSDYVAIMKKALTYLERNRVIRPLFSGNPCLSNPDIDLYLSPSNINNLRVKDGVLKSLSGGNIDPRNFMEFFLDAIGRGNVSIVEIADAADTSFEFVATYVQKFEERGLAQLEPITRNHRLAVIANTALTGAELV